MLVEMVVSHLLMLAALITNFIFLYRTTPLPPLFKNLFFITCTLDK
jgi:hypothetical protein